MKKKLISALVAVVMLLTMFPGTFSVRVNAAAKPASVKKKVTLYTDSPKYKIELKNVEDNAKIIYKSSDKSVITVKKGKVTPKGVGTAKVTVKVKQNDKTYKVKITFTVEEPVVEDYSEEAVSKSNLASLYKVERDVYSAILSGKTDDLSKDAKLLYDSVFEIAAELKGKTEYVTVKNIHDYLVLNMAYTYGGNEVHMLDYALSTGRCVCDGYAKAFFFLCKACGLDTILIDGTAWSSSGSELHAWNKVKIDGKWYSIDVTWDDPVPDEPGTVRYDYFLVTDADLSNDHKWEDEGIPDAVSDDLGIIYQQYKDYEKYDDARSAYDYIYNTLVAFAKEKKRGSSITLKLLVKGAGDSLANSCASLLGNLHDTYGCGYSYEFEGAGFYGLRINITLNY